MTELEKAAVEFILAKQAVSASKDLGPDAPFGAFTKALDVYEVAVKKLESLAVLKINELWEVKTK